MNTSTGRNPDIAALLLHRSILLLVFARPLSVSQNQVIFGYDVQWLFQPAMNFAFDTLRNGHFPLWNPHIFLGFPQYADPQLSTFYPLMSALAWMPVSRAISWLYFLHFGLTATGMYLLDRQQGARQAGGHIERINGTLRSRLRSLVRRTRDVARTAKRLEMELFWSGVVYNFCTVHTTLAGTPTMAAGITTKVWSIRRLLTMRTLEIGTLNSITSFCSAAYDITGFSLHYQLYTCSHSRGSGSVIICPENPLAPPLEARLETSVRIGDIFELIVLSADREEDSLDLTL